MRRLVTVCSLAMLAVCVCPVPAHAYFWEWLDSLSGPRFGGVIGELELVCPVKNDLSLSSSALDSIKMQLGVEKALHADAKRNFTNQEAQRFVDNAVRYRTEAERVLGEAIRLLADHDLRALDRGTNRRARLTATVVTALAWQERAAAHFAWARLLEEGKELDPRKQPGQYEKQPGAELERLSTDDEIVARMFPIGGVK